MKRRENEVRNTDSLANVGHILALGVFDVGIHGLPVVGNQEHGVRALERSRKGIHGVEVGLESPKSIFCLFYIE